MERGRTIMDRFELRRYGMLVGMYALGFIFCIGCWLFTSYHESKVYNRLTDSNTTMYDAMFTQLRVVEPMHRKE